MRLEKRQTLSRSAFVIAPLCALAATMLVAALLVMWAGKPVGQTFSLLIQGGFGSKFAWSETLTRAIPLILTGLAVAVAFRARLFNIGAEANSTQAHWRRWPWAACMAARASICRFRCCSC